MKVSRYVNAREMSFSVVKSNGFSIMSEYAFNVNSQRMLRKPCQNQQNSGFKF